jgi:SAM-dependent methyltransferase
MYDQIAHYYDLTHADLTADIPFILHLAQQTNGSLLELGCGSGRLLLPLARAGHPVIGLDNSPAMLERARTKLAKEAEAVQSRVRLVEADMAEFNLNGRAPHSRYPLILIPYNTFMHLDSAQALATLKRVKAHLGEDGKLFIDLANPFTVANTPEDHLLSLENVLTDNNDNILHLAANRLDTVEQTLHITWIYDRSPKSGGQIERTIAQATYHYRYPHQMELLLQEAGFRQFAFFGGYDQSPFQEESQRLLLIA